MKKQELFENKIIVLDSVLSKTECDFLINFYNRHGCTHGWAGTFPMTIDFKDQLVNQYIFKIEDNIKKMLSDKISVDWCEIVKWPHGSYKNDHFDTASNKTVFTSVTYLNDDYHGGETFIVNDMKIVPKIGRTVYFDGQFYKHGVSKVQNTDRYTVPIWYKYN
jgi:hypothetical protein